MGNCCHLKKYSRQTTLKITPNRDMNAWNNDWGNTIENIFGKDQEDSEVDFLMIPEMKIDLPKKESPRVENPEKPHPLYSGWHYMDEDEHASSASISIVSNKLKGHHIEQEEASTYSHIQEVSLNKTWQWQEDLGNENGVKHNEFYAKKVKKTFNASESKETNRKEEIKKNNRPKLTEQRLRLNRISYDKAESRPKKWASSEERPKVHDASYGEDSSHIQDSSEVGPLWQNYSYQEHKSHDLLSLILKRHHSKLSNYEEDKLSPGCKSPDENKFKTPSIRSWNNSPNPPMRIPSTDNISASISYNRQESSLSTTKPSFRLPPYPKKGVISPNSISKAFLDDNQGRRTKSVKKQL
ncbi:unnamed protein product [Blepharisma stoltei]|uniref:Uncharacterized protein n=1 Tax=Blepharisma stoltei TaxID=1481888 RepID=A0AAU9K7T0_9CILI|nr:unnamed protein product [Blepharisma stoltei]